MAIYNLVDLLNKGKLNLTSQTGARFVNPILFGSGIDGNGSDPSINNTGDDPIILQYKNLTLSNSFTMIPTNPCKALFIFVQETLTFGTNSKISMTGKYASGFDKSQFIIDNDLRRYLLFDKESLSFGHGGEWGGRSAYNHTSAKHYGSGSHSNGGGGGGGGYLGMNWDGDGVDAVGSTGANGNQAGGDGGDGGINGGYLYVCAKNIVGTSNLESKGTPGENGSNGTSTSDAGGASGFGGGGGAGGGGGKIHCASEDTFICSITGGVGGSPGSSVAVVPSGDEGTSGSNGTDGAYNFVLLQPITT